MWGGTREKHQLVYPQPSISIHPPRVGRDEDQEATAGEDQISIHPPRVGRDGLLKLYPPIPILISIHPPRVGRDLGSALASSTRLYFNPPSPCGEGPGKAGKLTVISEFQSTLPVWGGTRR